MSLALQMKGLTVMRVFAVALALSMLLAAAPISAQAPAQPAPRPGTPAGQTPPRPAGQAPAQPAPRPAAPAQPAAQAPAPAPQVPFPAGVKYGFVHIQRIAGESAEGKAATEKVKALNDQKVKELSEKNKLLQAAQQKLDQGGSALNDAARAELTASIERQQREIQRSTEDAQQDVQTLQQQLQEDFERKLVPVISRVAQEKQLHMIFSAADSGIVWGDPSLDLTTDVIRAFDASRGSTAAPAAPAAPATAR